MPRPGRERHLRATRDRPEVRTRWEDLSDVRRQLARLLLATNRPLKADEDIRTLTARKERLAENFRSAPGLIEVVNSAFASVWEHYPTLEVPARESTGPPAGVDLLIVDKSRRRWVEALGEDAFGDFGRDVAPWRAAEARLLARRIHELAGPNRTYPYSDVAVLVRAARDMDVYEQALMELRVPTYAVGGGGYWGQQQIGEGRECGEKYLKQPDLWQSDCSKCSVTRVESQPAVFPKALERPVSPTKALSRQGPDRFWRFGPGNRLRDINDTLSIFVKREGEIGVFRQGL